MMPATMINEHHDSYLKKKDWNVVSRTTWLT